MRDLEKVKIPFVKMHGLGNDFVLINCMDGNPTDLPELARHLCHRHFSVGADGMLAVVPHPDADCRMRIFNPDGSEAEMCGNGIRCVAKYLFDHGFTKSLTLKIATAAGIKSVAISLDCRGVAASASVEMGHPRISENIRDFPVEVSGADYRITGVNTGNPHGVVFVDDVEKVAIEIDGPALEILPIWPDRANIEFVSVISRHHLRQRTWERGAGITLACGTGATAAAWAAVMSGRADWPVEVQLDGGVLHFDINGRGQVVMTGPATEVFHSEIFI